METAKCAQGNCLRWLMHRLFYSPMKAEAVHFDEGNDEIVALGGSTAGEKFSWGRDVGRETWCGLAVVGISCHASRKGPRVCRKAFNRLSVEIY